MKYLALLLILLPLPAVAADTAAGPWGIFGQVFADVLRGADTAAQRDTDVAQFCTLLEQLEEQTTYGAQRRGWNVERLTWSGKLRRATTTAEAGQLLIDYDVALRDEALTADGLAERAAWRTRAGEAASVAALAELLRARAWTLTRDAMDDSWERASGAWLAAVSALAGEYAAAVTPVAAAVSVPATERVAPGELLRQLEAALKREMLAKSWRNRRAAWLAATRQPLTGEVLRQLGEACLPAAFAGEWDLSGWSARTRDAADTAAELELLRELEDQLAWEATGREWPQEREAWLQALEAWLAPEAVSLPAVAVNAATETTVRAALLHLDQALKVSAQQDAWFARRTAWAGALATAADARGLAQGLTVFAGGMQAVSFTPAWAERTAAWQAAAAAADSVAVVAALLAELETYLDPSALVITWPQDRATWRGTLGFGTGSVPVLTAPATAVQEGPAAAVPHIIQAPAVPSAPTEAQCETLVACAQELEMRIRFTAQTAAWSNERRLRWIAENRDARDAAAVQRQLLALEESLRDSALRDPAGRAAWRERMPGAGFAAALAAQLRALEAALATGATDPSWQARRAGWLAKLAALEQNG